MTTEREEKVDGRELRAIKNRQAIIDALVMLALDGANPSIDEIAQAAGISVRSVYRHFENLDDARRLAAEQVAAVALDHLQRASGPLDSTRPLVDRCHSLVHARFELHMHLGGLARNFSRVAADRPHASGQYKAAVKMCSDQVATLFAPEFAAMSPADRNIAHTMLDALASFETVNQLLSIERVDRDALATGLCRQLLAVFSGSPSETA